MSRSEQLLLNLRPRTDARLADFASPTHAPVLAAAEDLLGEKGGLLYLYGETGAGRSHLLAALCIEAEQLGMAAVLLPFGELAALSPEVLDGLDGQDLIACDDVDAIAGQADWEEGLFHLFNRSRESGARLVFAAALPPAREAFTLPDLVSRLSLAPCWELGLLDDASRLVLLETAARRRGLFMEPAVLAWLVRRGPRLPGQLLALLETADRQSLSAGRRLTVPFLSQILEVQGFPVS